MRFAPFLTSTVLGMLMLGAAPAPAAPAATAPEDFNLRYSLIPRDEIQSGGPPKDGIPALTNPAFLDPAAADYLAPEDLVIGVNLGGEAKAYPLRIMVWHEIANDTVGGIPAAVTYCPLCQSALVFDRNVGGEERTFGVSGKLYNSNVLMYDRQEESRDESLWSQGEMRAVAGPAAEKGLTLELHPAELTNWADWRSRHPGTVVMSEQTGHQRAYRSKAYASYFSHDRVRFHPEMQAERPRGFRNKELLVVVYAGDAAKAYAVSDVKSAGGTIEDSVGSRSIRLVYVPEGASVRVETTDDRAPPDVAYMFWFALSALQPHVELYRP